MPDLVECYSGAEYAERPIALVWEGQRLEIKEILNRRREPGEKWFQVQTQDDQIFNLIYVEANDEWKIQKL